MPTLVYRKRGRPNAFVFGAQDTPITIGRNTNCVIVVDSAGVSRQHAEISTSDEGNSWEIRDLRSVNGTFVNGERVESRVLVDKDVISCGEFLMEFRRGPGSGRVHMNLHQEGFTSTRGSSSAAVRKSSEFAVEEPNERKATSFVDHTVDLDPAPEFGPLYRRIHELEANNQTLEDEILLLRKTIHGMRHGSNLTSVEVELPIESTPTVVRAPKIDAPEQESFARLLDHVSPPIATAISLMMDLDRRRNAVLEQVLGLIAQMQNAENSEEETSHEDIEDDS